MLDVSVHEVGDTQVVVPTGELDLATAHALGARLATAGERGTRVVLDLRGLSFVDSSGIAMIIKIKRHFTVEGIPFGVIKGNDIIQRAFSLSHVEPLLPWTEAPTSTP